MTEKCFKELADALGATRPDDRNGPGYTPAKCKQWLFDVEAIADACKGNNPRFSVEKFYEACGYDPGQEF